MSREWYETNGLNYSDLDPRFEDDDAYRHWADSLTGAVKISDKAANLEDSASILGLQLCLRSWAELCDRRFFAEYPEFTRRQRPAYPGESWELACFAADEPQGAAVPTVRVSHPGIRSSKYEFIHPEKFTFQTAMLKRVSVRGRSKVVLEPIDFGDRQLVGLLYLALGVWAGSSDQRWFQVHPDETTRERFVCPGELEQKRVRGVREFVEVRRLGESLLRVPMQDPEPPRRAPRWHGGEDVIPERYAPSRLYPCHGLRGLAEAPRSI